MKQPKKKGRPPIEFKTLRFSLSVVNDLFAFLQSRRKEVRALLTAYKSFVENAKEGETFRFKYVGEIKSTKIKTIK